MIEEVVVAEVVIIVERSHKLSVTKIFKIRQPEYKINKNKEVEIQVCLANVSVVVRTGCMDMPVTLLVCAG